MIEGVGLHPPYRSIGVYMIARKYRVTYRESNHKGDFYPPKAVVFNTRSWFEKPRSDLVQQARDIVYNTTPLMFTIQHIERVYD